MHQDHDNLWAPWRWDYIRQLDPDAGQPTDKTPPTPACFLCQAAATAATCPDAQDRLVLVQDERGVLLLNRYPYTNGHLLVAPRDHLAQLTDLTRDQRAGLIDLTTLAQQLLTTAINPQGFNIGINLGRCAGAGLPGHLHVHIVPRWSGDTNFMQVVGQIRVIPQALEVCYQQLQHSLENLDPDPSSPGLD